MTYILDTHTLLWLRLNPNKLSKEHKTILESPRDEKCVSVLSAWEISLKFSLEKLDLGNHTPDEFMASIPKLGLKIITPTPEQFATYYLLPKIYKHKDPFDRMIIWQAIRSGLTLLSADKKFSEYKPHGLLVA
jgi:PIN domain nuclease of toxin-antitoxin system